MLSMFSKFSMHIWSYHEVWMRSFLYIGSLRIKVVLACQEVMKWDWLLGELIHNVLYSNLQTNSIHYIKTDWTWKRFGCKTTNSPPKLLLNWRVTLLSYTKGKKNILHMGQWWSRTQSKYLLPKASMLHKTSCTWDNQTLQTYLSFIKSRKTTDNKAFK